MRQRVFCPYSNYFDWVKSSTYFSISAIKRKLEQETHKHREHGERVEKMTCIENQKSKCPQILFKKKNVTKGLYVCGFVKKKKKEEWEKNWLNKFGDAAE